MGFDIPNLAEAAFPAQAEPDSVDFEIINAAIGRTGVVSGCAVTAQGTPDMTVAVASGIVESGGTALTVASGNVTIAAADGTNPRFDLIVVDSSGVKRRRGGTAAAAPVFPVPTAGDVVLAAIYVPAADTAIASNQITDKRVVLSSGGSSAGTVLVSGGGVVWQTGYTYLVAAGSGFINGAFVTWAQQSITLDAAHATLDRIDVIAVDNTGTVVKVTGTAAANPSEPVVDVTTQLKLALVIVEDNTTQPSISSETLYLENAGSPTEWAWSTSGVGFDPNGTTNPRTGSKAISGTNVASNAYAQAQRGSGTIDPNSFDYLVLYIRFSNVWNSSRYLRVSLLSGGVQKGNALRISGGHFGLDPNNVTTYQAVIIPALQFAVPAGTSIDQVRIQDVGGSISFWIDDIAWLADASINQPGGITQEQADARYQQLSGKDAASGYAGLLANKGLRLDGPLEQDYTNKGDNTGATTVNLDDGNVQRVRLTGNVTFTFSGSTNGEACSLTLILVQDGTGGRTVTWPGSVDWEAATAPTLSTAANSVDILTFVTVDGGTTWYGFLVGKGMA